MPKNKLESFSVNFETLPYLVDMETEKDIRKSVFIQCKIFTDSIFEAIRILNNPMDGNGDLHNRTRHLILIGVSFVAEMHEQFEKLLEITEAKDEQSK